MTTELLRDVTTRLSHFQGFHSLVITYANRLGEHMSDAGGFTRFSCIIAVDSLVNVRLKITLGNEVVCTEYHTLEMSPKALNTVGGDTILRIHLLAVFNHGVLISHLVNARV